MMTPPGISLFVGFYQGQNLAKRKKKQNNG